MTAFLKSALGAVNPRALQIAGALTAYAVLGGLLSLYLAGVLYALANRQLPNLQHWDAWLDGWALFGDRVQQRGKLQFAAGAALFLVFGSPGLIVLAHRNRPRPLHGDARFATTREIERAGFFTQGSGIIVGKYGERFLVFGGQQFVLLAAPTRSGKGVGVVIPNLLNFADSVVVLDIKLENFKATAGYRAAHGQKVFLFAPFNEDGATHAWNPLDGIRRDKHLRIGDVLAIAQVLYPHDASRESFWNDQARNLFLGLCLYLLDTPELPCTFGELLRQSSGKGQPLKEYLGGLLKARANGPQVVSHVAQDALNRFISTSDNTFSGILATFNAPLTIFANPIVDAATSRSDFELEDVRKKRLSIYLGVQPNRLADAALLMNLFFSQLINVNTRELPEDNPELKHQCLLILDEFTAIGRIGVLAKGVAYLAGYNLRLLPIVQSLAQLQSVYGDRETRTFVANHAVQIVFAPREQRDAVEYSEMLGYRTENHRSRSVTRSRGLDRAQPGSVSETESAQRRALMLPQELRELGDTQEIVFSGRCRPILCQKIIYLTDPAFTARLMKPPVIDALRFDDYQARVEQRIRVLRADEAIDLERVVKPTKLPPLDDPINPSDDSLHGVLDAGFKQYNLPSREETQAFLRHIERAQQAAQTTADLEAP